MTVFFSTQLYHIPVGFALLFYADFKI